MVKQTPPRTMFTPKPTQVFDTPWSFTYDPPLEQCGAWWRWRYSERVQNMELNIIAFGFSVLPVLVVLAVLRK